MKIKKLVSFMLTIAMALSMVAALGITASAAKLYACKVGEAYYATVDEARHNAESGSTIVLLHDISEDLYFEYGDEFTLDLNGHGIVNNVATNKTIHNNEGTLTIIDSNPTAEHYFTFVEDGAWTLIKSPTSEQRVSAVVSYEADAEHPVVKICGGYVTGNGIKNNGGTLTVERANLVGNHHTDGALQNVNGEVVYKNGEIVGNTGAEGGAIVNRNGIMTLGVLNADNKNFIIAHNTATLYNGGAISSFVNIVDQENDCQGSQLTLNSGYIVGNKAAEKGGAIFNGITYTPYQFSIAAFKMYGGVIESNEAGLNGGGVSNFASGSNGTAIFELYNGSVISNKCVNRTAQDKGGNGGGVANTGDFRMYGGVIAENQANLGGGVYNARLFTMMNGEVKENKAVLSPNNPQANGLIGGVYNDGNLGLGAAAFLWGGSVKDNTAARMVGGIFNEYGVLVLSGATVTGNKSPFVGGIAQFGIMAVGGNTLIDGNLEGTKASNLLLADMSALSGKQPLILGDGSVKTLAEGVEINVPALASTAKIGVTYAATLNTTTYAFTKGAGRLTDAGTETQVANFTSDYDLTNVSYHTDGYIELIANVAYLDLDSTTADVKDSKSIDQNYSLAVTTFTTASGGVTKVKVSWVITDINAMRIDNKVWDTTELKWVVADSETIVMDTGAANFTFENYSSVKVDASVSFTAESGFNPTVSYTDQKSKITLDTANGNSTYSKTNVPTGTIGVTVKPGTTDFTTASATDSAKYGTYTVKIGEHSCEVCPVISAYNTAYFACLENASSYAQLFAMSKSDFRTNNNPSTEDETKHDAYEAAFDAVRDAKDDDLLLVEEIGVFDDGSTELFDEVQEENYKFTVQKYSCKEDPAVFLYMFAK